MGSFLVGEYLEVSLEKIQKEYDYDTHYEVLPELIVLSSYYLFLNSSKSNIDFARKIQGDGLRFFYKIDDSMLKSRIVFAFDIVDKFTLIENGVQRLFSDAENLLVYNILNERILVNRVSFGMIAIFRLQHNHVKNEEVLLSLIILIKDIYIRIEQIMNEFRSSDQTKIFFFINACLKIDICPQIVTALVSKIESVFTKIDFTLSNRLNLTTINNFLALFFLTNNEIEKKEMLCTIYNRVELIVKDYKELNFDILCFILNTMEDEKFTKSVHKILLDHLQIDMEKITFEKIRGEQTKLLCYYNLTLLSIKKEQDRSWEHLIFRNFK
ncbi:hypothetical protein [Sphingobacterium faecium]|jgi:hypothetical protein|uniref:hypothetical protein n=2 Tax=Sphingobacterium faecium TaxID=34087 RepID=UPI002479AAF9|nr:hypothetical protein [Sphingobacterium faecium]WGQ14323.1 hypothetical protein QG727_20140 [Sphingobacterium faecium]